MALDWGSPRFYGFIVWTSIIGGSVTQNEDFLQLTTAQGNGQPAGLGEVLLEPNVGPHLEAWQGFTDALYSCALYFSCPSLVAIGLTVLLPSLMAETPSTGLWKSKGLCEPGQVVPPQPLCSLVSLAQLWSHKPWKTRGCWLPKISLVCNQVSSRKGQGMLICLSVCERLCMYLCHFVPMWLHGCLDTCLLVCFYMFYIRPHCLVSMGFRRYIVNLAKLWAFVVDTKR